MGRDYRRRDLSRGPGHPHRVTGRGGGSGHRTPRAGLSTLTNFSSRSQAPFTSVSYFGVTGSLKGDPMTALLVLLIPTMFFAGVVSVASFHFKHEALRLSLAIN